MSVPERMRTYSSALAAVRVKRGSTTIILAPVSFACSMCSIDTGCASAALRADVQRALASSACRCTSWSSRRSPRCSRRRRPWSSGRCAPGGRSCWCRRSSRTCAAGTPARCCACDEPTQKTESGPLALRSSSSLALISLSAWSQLMRWYLPLTSFIGYLQAVFAVAVLAQRRALGAVRAEVDRRIEHRLLAHPHAVLDHGVDRAADRAVRADGALDLDLAGADGRRRRRPAFGLPHQRELARPRGRRRRRGPSGAGTRAGPSSAARCDSRAAGCDEAATADAAARGRAAPERFAGQQHGGRLGLRPRWSRSSA